MRRAAMLPAAPDASSSAHEPELGGLPGSFGGGADITVASCTDGSVCVYDLRARGDDACVIRFVEHRQWVVGVHRQRGGHLLASCSTGGDVRFWDLRQPEGSVTKVEAFGRSASSARLPRQPALTAFAMHDYSSVLAVGAREQFIRVFTAADDTLIMIRHHDGFTGQRIGPVKCLSFHPYRMMLADCAIMVPSAIRHGT